MDCNEFKQTVGADPNTADTRCLEHESVCDACSGWADEMRLLDTKIAEALRIDIPDIELPGLDSNVTYLRPERSRKTRPHFFALAASMLLGIGVAFGLWWVTGSDSLAAGSLAHVHHERYSWVASEVPVDAEQLNAVLSKVNVTLDGDVGLITYARDCWVDRHRVAHLVVQGSNGPVMILIMPRSTTPNVEPLVEPGYEGRLIPVGQGSIAIVGGEGERLDLIEEKFIQAVEWEV